MYLKVQVTLETANPRATRVFALDPELTLDRVHAVLQGAFGWRNCHLHQFTQRNCAMEDAKFFIYPGWDPEMLEFSYFAGPEQEITAGEVLREAGDFIYYEYDFGDSWQHRLELVGTAEPADFSYVIEGAGETPEEDSRGLQSEEELSAHVLSDATIAEINSAIKASVNHRVSADTAIAYGNRVGPFFDATWERSVFSRNRQLHSLFELVMEQPVPELTPELETELELALAPWLDFLDEAANEIPLTQAGYLAPKFTAGFVAKWKIQAHTKSNREEDIPQIWGFHEDSKKAGLTRKYRGGLRLSSKGKAARNDLPELVRRLVAGCFESNKDDFNHDAMIVLLMLIATGTFGYDLQLRFRAEHPLEETVAELLSSHWQFNGGPPNYFNVMAARNPLDTVLNPLHASVRLSPEPVRYCAWLGLQA